MRVGIWELIVIAAVIALLFNGRRISRLFEAAKRSKKTYQEGLEEPVDVDFRDLSEEHRNENKRV